jgi:hypothetical protein
VVKAEDSWLRGHGLKPPLRRPFFRHHSFGSKPGAKIKWKLTWHCCICCNPVKGRVEFEDSWLIKSSFLTKVPHKKKSLTNSKFIFSSTYRPNLTSTFYLNQDALLKFIRPSVHPSVCLLLLLFFSRFVNNVRPLICLFVCLSVCLFICHLSVCPSVYLSICPSVRLSICPSVRLSVCPFVLLFLLS